MNEGSVGRRYARALFSIARDENLIQEIGADLDTFARAVASGGVSLGNVLFTPLFTQSERRRVVQGLLPALGLHPHVARFIGLLVEKNRLKAFPDIVRAYGEFADEAAGRVRATVTTTTDINPILQARVGEAIARATGKQVVLETKVDPSLLGGTVARVGTWLFDASVKTRLEHLKLTLTTNPGQA